MRLRSLSSAWTSRRVSAVGSVSLLLVVVALCAWVGVRALQARSAVTAATADGQRLRTELRAYDLTGAGATLTRLRVHVDQAHSATGGPAWAIAARLPMVGRNLTAARAAAAQAASVTDAARPLEGALPALARSKSTTSGGQVDTAALQQISTTIAPLSAAVSRADQRMDGMSSSHLTGSVAHGVETLRALLGEAKAPLATAGPTMQMLTQMMGADGPRSWMVLLQQDAEARGTGGIVGSYSVITTDHGRVTLDRTMSRTTLDSGVRIPASAVPVALQQLWGSDLQEWAGLNLSPHFPWTGQLVSAGWRARGGTTPLDYVAAIDGHAVAVLLQASGPVTVRGVQVTSANVNAFLTTTVYTTFRDPKVVDAVTAELVSDVFARFSTGRFNLPALVHGLAAPVQEHRVMVWAADPSQERLLSAHPVGGALPQSRGPFAMAVVNNGAGNKLDAYLHVATSYTPGTCNQSVRIGRISVRLTNSAPPHGLPAYVTERNDVRDPGATKAAAGSNEELVDIYGPVGSNAPLVTIDGRSDNEIVVGVDRQHPVWRARVSISPGQTRTVTAVVVESVRRTDPTHATVLAQPMANPVSVRSGPVSRCVE